MDNLCTTRKCKITTETAHFKIGVGNLDYCLDLRVLGCAGHVERMGEERLPKILRDSFMDLPQKRGRPSRSHADQMRDGLKRKQTSMAEWKKIAANRTEWKRAIRAPSIYTDKNNNRFAEWLREPKMLLGSAVEKNLAKNGTPAKSATAMWTRTQTKSRGRCSTTTGTAPTTTANN